MRIKPLTGQVLVLLLPHDEKDGSIIIPDIANDAKPTHDNMFVRMGHRKGIVQAIGPWRKTKSGHAVLPDVKKGDTVMLNPYLGQKLTHDANDHLRLVKVDDILAVLTNDD